MRNLLDLILSMLSLSAGEAAEGDGAPAPKEGADKPASATEGGTEDGDSGFFEEDGEEAPAPAKAKPAKAPARTVTQDPDDDDAAARSESDEDDEDDDADGDDAESEEDGDNSEGDGGETSADSAAALSIRRGWEARFEASKAEKRADPLAGIVESVKITDAVRERVKAKFAEEDDVGAIEEVVRAILPAALGAYDERRVTPVLDATTVTARNARLVQNVQSFDSKYPNVRTPEVSARMAKVYDEYKEKYGYQAADQVPVEDYFHMAGGRLPRKGAKPVQKNEGVKGKAAEKDKQGAVQATRQPERIATPQPNGKGKPKVDDTVHRTVETIRRTRFEPFVIR